MKRKFDLGTSREEIERFVQTGSSTTEDGEPLDRVNFVLPRRLRMQFNREAAHRDIKKQDLVREIFEYYFAKKDRNLS